MSLLLRCVHLQREKFAIMKERMPAYILSNIFFKAY